jgi:hypothetical protein
MGRSSSDALVGTVTRSCWSIATPICSPPPGTSSPTMTDWPPIFAVDLVGSASVLDVLAPLVIPGTAAACFASMAARIVATQHDAAVDAVLDGPLHPDFLRGIDGAVGERIVDSAIAEQGSLERSSGQGRPSGASVAG